MMDYRADGSCRGCLMGAALYAVGSRNWDSKTPKRWPWLPQEHTLQCPWCPLHTEQRGWSWVTHFANHYEYKTATIEQIAEYLNKTFEPKPVKEPQREREEATHATQPSDVARITGD